MSEEPDAEPERRHSVPDEPELVQDERERAKREVANGLRQFDAGKDAAQQAIEYAKLMATSSGYGCR